MTRKRPERITEVIREIEALAKRLRADLRRAARDTGLTRNLQRAAEVLRKQAALMAALVEKYAHELRMELAAGRARGPARRKRAA